MDEMREAARIAGYRPAVLEDLMAMKDLEVAMVDGEPMVRTEAGEESPLQEYVDTHLADYRPALTTGAAVDEHLAAKADRAAAAVDPLNPSTEDRS